MKPLSRKQTLEIQAGADALLAPGGGGIAVWVRRDELQPRVAVRFSTAIKEGEEIDAVQIATILATLQVGVHRITQAMADQMNIPREDLQAMVETTFKVLAPHYEAATNIIRKE